MKRVALILLGFIYNATLMARQLPPEQKKEYLTTIQVPPGLVAD